MYVSYIFAYHPATVDKRCNVDRVTVDMLPEVALLRIFDCYVNQAREQEGREPDKIQEWHTDYAGARVPTMAGHRPWVTTSLGPSTLLHRQNPGEGDVGCLASLAHRHKAILPRNTNG